MSAFFRITMALLALSTLYFLPQEGAAYSYGPACQWLRLSGQVELPPGAAPEGPLLISVSYQLDGQDNPGQLLTNYPLAGPRFFFILSGFDKKWDQAIFVEPGFFFAKEILFRYYVKSSDGRWKSDFGQVRYIPQPIPQITIPKNQDEVFECKTHLKLDPIVLKETY